MKNLVFERKHDEIDFILTTKEVCSIIGFSRQTVYRMVKSGEFPAPAKLGTRRVGWKTSHVNGWLDAKFEKRASA